jgi:hypothetical protein
MIRADQLPVPLDEIMLSYQEVFGVSYSIARPLTLLTTRERMASGSVEFIG